jgi:enoyl-CoA hydratase
MGAFLMLCADERYGVRGDYRIGMNEVAIGLTVPRFALELAKHRLSHAGLARVATGALFDPESAVAAGYLDRVVPEGELDAIVEAAAARLLAINLDSYAATKNRLNQRLSNTILGLADPVTLRAELLSLSNV